MIENKNDASRNLEKALQALEQAKQRVANKKKTEREEAQSQETTPPQSTLINAENESGGRYGMTMATELKSRLFHRLEILTKQWRESGCNKL